MHHLHHLHPGAQASLPLDPRLKLLLTATLLAMVITSRAFLFPLLVAGICLTTLLALRVPPRRLLLRFAEPLFIASMLVLLKTFFSGQTPLFQAPLAGFTVTAYAEGLHDGLLTASRIAAAVSVVGLLGFTTTFTDIMAGLAWLRVPQTFVDICLFAYRYLFLLLEEAQVVYSAQKNRLGYTGFRRSLTSFGTLAGTLVIKAFDNSQAVTTAMVQRGYDGRMPLMRHEPLRKREMAASLLTVSTFIFLWQM